MSRALLPLATLVLLCGCERKEEIAPTPTPAPSPRRVASSDSPPVVRTKTHAPHLTPDSQRDKAQLEAIRREEARVMAHCIRNAVDQYHTDYDVLPQPASARKLLDCETDTSADEGLIGVLKGMDFTQNSRQTDYLGMAREDKGLGLGGLVKVGGGENVSTELVDPWGHHYRVTLDLDMDKKVRNPMEDQMDTGMPLLAEEFIIWSIGPDGDATTWEDNIISWDPEKSRLPRKPAATSRR